MERSKPKFLPKNITALFQPMDQDIIPACKAYYHSEVPGRVVSSELLVTESLRTLSLKDVTYNVGVAWGKIMPTTTAKFQKKGCWRR
jgi:hypothetical protein